MPTEIILYKIFLSSPSDLKEERLLVEECVSSLNRVLEESHGIQLKLLKWENDTYPAAGIDVQKVISTQIGNDYDIFIGMLWKTYGTPTMDAESGTEEEFESALKRYQQNSSNVQIMFYFKTAPPSSMNEIIGVEIDKISKFKIRLGQLGILYDEFTDLLNFQQILQIHLLKRVMSLSSTTRRPIHRHHPEAAVSKTSQEHNQIGFLDLIEHAELAMNQLSEIVSNMAEEMTNFTELTIGVTQKINRASHSGSQAQKIREPKRIIDLYADQILSFNSRYEILLEDYKQHASTAFNDLIAALIMSRDFDLKNSEDYKNALRVVSYLKEMILEASVTFQELIETVLGGPGMTTKLIRARNAFSQTIAALIIEFGNSINVLNEIEK